MTMMMMTTAAMLYESKKKEVKNAKHLEWNIIFDKVVSQLFAF